MPRYTIIGAMRDTGENVRADVTAPDEATAKRGANENGVLIESVHLMPDQDPAAPELVWYGAMICRACGYQWQARKSTPPAKCPGCSKRDVEPVRVPKRATGCAGMILIWVGVGAALMLMK